jgi:hypothetical protein
MPKKDDNKITFRELDGNTVQIHVSGDMLPNSKYLFILELMKGYVGSKEIVFQADNPQMMMLIRNAIPSEYYARIEIAGSGALKQEGELRDAG